MDELDNTPALSSPPIPIAASTTSKLNKNSESKFELLDNIDESLGILSIKSGDLSELNLASEQLKCEKLKAVTSLNRASVSCISNLFLKIPSNTTTTTTSSSSSSQSPSPSTSYNLNKLNCDSTVNSNDLMNSINKESLSESFARASLAIIDPNVSIDNVLSNCSKTMNNSTFTPLKDAYEQLLKDEYSLIKSTQLPANSQDFSLNSNENPSIGNYFKKKSTELSKIFNKSESEIHNDTISDITGEPLLSVDESTLETSENKYNQNNSSLTVSKIAQLLSETDNTPDKIYNYLMQLEKHNLPSSSKENVDLLKSPKCSLELNKSSTSVKSATNLPDGKLPIESTKNEIIWSCVKPGKCVMKDFVIRNKSSNRLKIQAYITSSAYKLLHNRSDTESFNNLKILLHPHESKCINVAFCPIGNGAAIDEIRFTPIDVNLEQTRKQCIKLYGYGGYGNLELQDITKDTTGKFWLSLGYISEKPEYSHTFTVHNTGSLSIFSLITFNPKEAFVYRNIKIIPNSFILLPNERKFVTCKFIPTKLDIERLRLNVKSMVEIGILKIIYGTEINRWRIKKLSSNEKINKNLSSLNKQLIDLVLDGETKPNDLNKFNESPDSMMEILQHIYHNEIVLTLEQDPDRTLLAAFLDDTCATFHTLTSNQTINIPQTTLKSSCIVQPSAIILTPPIKLEDIIFIESKYDNKIYYEVRCLPLDGGLKVQPNSGYLIPDEVLLIRIKCCKKENADYNINVCIGNETFPIHIKVVLL